MISKDHILDEIRRTGELNGGTPLGRARFEAATGIKMSDWWGKHWARWSEAVREAGFEPLSFNEAFDDELIIRKFIDLAREVRGFPTSAQRRLKQRQDPSFPSHNVYARLGKNSELAARVIAYCEEQEGFEDIVALCATVAVKAAPAESRSPSEDQDIGEVYLVKMGKHYKIGRSNAAGRRAYELAIQMPEKITTVHVIKTDDPVGIEAYWHNRFADRRGNGEWFDLTAADVAAFRRRKFM